MENCTVSWCRVNTFQFLDFGDGGRAILQNDLGDQCICGSQYQGDADIAGRGVTIAFIVSAGLCCLFVTLYGLLSTRKGSIPQDPLTGDTADDVVERKALAVSPGDGDESGQEGSLVVDESTPHLTPSPMRCGCSDPAICVCKPNSSLSSLSHRTFNPIDRWSRRVIKPRCRKAVSWIGIDPDALCAALSAGVVGLTDQQAITSLALIIAASIQMFDTESPLSVQHLTIIADLVCLGLSASIFATSLIRGGYSGKSTRKTESRGRRRRRRFIVSIRIFLVIASSASLFVCMWWTSVESGAAQPECPALCIVRTQEPRWAGQGIMRVVFIVCLLLYFISFLATSLTLRRLWVRYVSLRIYPQKDIPPAPLFTRSASSSKRPVPTSATQENSPKKTAATVLRYMRLAITMPLWIVWVTIMSGLLAQSLFVWIGFSANIAILVDDRQYGQIWMDDGGAAENQWGFGQLVAVFVLVIPFLSMWDAYSDFANAREEESESASSGDTVPLLEQSDSAKVEA